MDWILFVLDFQVNQSAFKWTDFAGNWAYDLLMFNAISLRWTRSPQNVWKVMKLNLLTLSTTLFFSFIISVKHGVKISSRIFWSIIRSSLLLNLWPYCSDPPIIVKSLNYYWTKLLCGTAHCCLMTFISSMHCHCLGSTVDGVELILPWLYTTFHTQRYFISS